MKKSILMFIALGGLISCEPRTGLQEIEWSKNSGKPLPAELKKIDLKSDIQKQTRFEKIEFLSQQVEGVPLESAFVKKIEIAVHRLLGYL
jgi:hypothetical protein